MQLHFYVPDDVAVALRRQAEARGISLSRYLAEIAQREVATGWPEGFFQKVLGGWKGDPLDRSEPGTYEIRDPLGFRLQDE